VLRVEKTDHAMGSTFSIVLYGRDRPHLEAAAGAALAELHRLDAMLSNYMADSEWSAVNRLAAVEPVRVSAELFALLSACLTYSEQSEGAFDITVGPLMKTWGFYKDEGKLPDRSAVDETLARVGYQHVRLDPGARTIRFDHKGVELDPGGIGKGYAVDRMVDVLKTTGVNVAFVSAAGSSIYGLGAPPDGPQGWPVTIRHPRDRSKTAAQIFLKNRSISTSGGYEKFFWADGRRYSHIIDPRTGYPSQRAASVSVITSRAIDSEAWTKPYFVNGLAWTKAHKPSGVAVFFCKPGTRAKCQWVD
jgi:thiamine biosynthesis lipoprotein